MSHPQARAAHCGCVFAWTRSAAARLAFALCGAKIDVREVFGAGSPGGSGSSSKTSSAAPARRPSTSAVVNAVSSTSCPRAVLIRTAAGFICRELRLVNQVPILGAQIGVQGDEVAFGEQRLQRHHCHAEVTLLVRFVGG